MSTKNRLVAIIHVDNLSGGKYMKKTDMKFEEKFSSEIETPISYLFFYLNRNPHNQCPSAGTFLYSTKFEFAHGCHRHLYLSMVEDYHYESIHVFDRHRPIMKTNATDKTC